MTSPFIDHSFSTSEIRILRALTKGQRPLSEISRSLSMKPSLISYLLRKLSDKDLITVTKYGSNKSVDFASSKHALLLRDLLLAHDHIDWENVLHGMAIDILLWILDRERTGNHSFSRTSLWRHSRNLEPRGILGQDDQGYRINPRFQRLKDFLEEYQRFIMTKMVQSLSKGAVIIWQEDMECLFEVPRRIEPPSKGFFETATSSFNKFGLPLFTQNEVYFYSGKKTELRVEDVILHTLMSEQGEVRYMLYSLLLMKKEWRNIDRRFLLSESGKYGLTSEVSRMLQFLETNGSRREGSRLPTWEEFQEKAIEYGVIH